MVQRGCCNIREEKFNVSCIECIIGLIILLNPVYVWPKLIFGCGSSCGHSQAAKEYAEFLKGGHDAVLEAVLERGTFEKLYSYTMVLNAFAVQLTSVTDQVLPFYPHVLCFQPLSIVHWQKIGQKALCSGRLRACTPLERFMSRSSSCNLLFRSACEVLD